MFGWIGLLDFITSGYVERSDKYTEFEMAIPLWWYILWLSVMLSIFILPMYYIHLWIVVNGYRKSNIGTTERIHVLFKNENKTIRICVINRSLPFSHHIRDLPPPVYQNSPQTNDEAPAPANINHVQSIPSCNEIIYIS